VNPEFFQHIEQGLSTERLGAYAVNRSDAAPDARATLARYLLNMALCESLYSPLQLCEIALRNSIHRHASGLMGQHDWYDHPNFLLTSWAANEVAKAKAKITKSGKSLTAARVVAELQFGFWTSLFEDHYEKRTPFLPSAFKAVFPHLPKSLHKRKERKGDLETIRVLRNRVFHHERIVHWKDLDAQHQRILEVIAWVSPELRQMADALDRFQVVRKSGLKPWLCKLQRHWPHASTAAQASASTSRIESVTEPFDASNGAETPFGHRWGDEVFTLSQEHLEAIQSGQSLALDVMNEYVVFLKAEIETKKGGGK
jgi:hypothetical protein